MNAYWNENAGRFVGRVLSEPVFSHENHGEDYFRVMLRIDRLSGAEDTLPLLVSRTQLEQTPVFAGERLAAEGEVRSFNNRSGVGESAGADGVRARAVRGGGGRAGLQPAHAPGYAVPRAGLPAYPAGAGDLRSDAGGEPALWPGGLPSLYLLGRGGPGLRRTERGGTPFGWRAGSRAAATSKSWASRAFPAWPTRSPPCRWSGWRSLLLQDRRNNFAFFLKIKLDKRAE